MSSGRVPRPGPTVMTCFTNFKAGDERLTAMEGDQHMIELVSARVLAYPHRSRIDRRRSHPRGALSPGLVRPHVDVAVVAGQVAATGHLEDELAEWTRSRQCIIHGRWLLKPANKPLRSLSCRTRSKAGGEPTGPPRHLGQDRRTDASHNRAIRSNVVLDRSTRMAASSGGSSVNSRPPAGFTCSTQLCRDCVTAATGRGVSPGSISAARQVRTWRRG